ncbi:hypothetical protein VF14_18460 [Nostoc linckia z18]|uniref:Phage tail protein n=1 Tax=Nostoc linckia z7 TaxID=1628745 RepID=A0ABX4KFM8_NOSLI|nr:hypothetical protein [Nostoc linckia]PHJ92854.1 hypothetical protein VF04_27785 [Nostoc linckia z7]PHK09358.1 hypothetical protein VF09_16215 [Nostoc linckia z9]PHK09567.1 hypothetical protein VF10_36155 [Nostoc linckia z13]PHK33097.1 hypothetical protein VF14_18460 [Nostoc linckia z18]
MPFATSRAINILAVKARNQEQSKIPDVFDVRTNWLLKKGAMPVEASSKRQWPNVHAVIGVKDKIPALNVTGGDWGGETAGTMGVPLSSNGADMGTREKLNPGKRVLRPSLHPKALLDASKVLKPAKAMRKRKTQASLRTVLKYNRPFITNIKAGNNLKGRHVLAVRTTRKRYPLQVLYIFKKKVKIPRQWFLDKNVEKFVRQEFAVIFRRELDRALASRKK